MSERNRMAEWLDDAAAYALGQLDGAALERFERALAERGGGAAEALAEFAPAAARVGLAAPAARPTPRLKRRLLSQVGDEQGVYFLAAGEGEWEEPAPGVRLRRLFVDPRDGRETRELALAPGDHALADLVAAGAGLLVVGGALHVDGEAMRAVDWHRRGREPLARARVAEPTRLVVFDAARSAEPAASSRTVRADAGRWRELGGGSWGRVLEVNAVTRGSVMDVRMDSGGSLPAHEHGGAEQVLMISGDCHAMGRTFGPDDFHRARAGTRHTDAITRTGCRMLNLIEGPLLPL